MGQKENKEENKGEEKKGEEKKEEKKEEESPEIVLKVDMHCEACAKRVARALKGFEGVESVETNLAKGQVTVKGVVEPAKLVDYVHKITGEQASIVKG